MPVVVLMGVSGSGKSTIGPLLADALAGTYVEGDSFHPPQNVEKMRNGTPLRDEDRWPWLEAMATAVRAWQREGKTVVLSCSALKQSYRDVLARDGGVSFVWLRGEKALIAERLAARRGHFMPSSLLDSQFAILERPTDAIVADISQPPADLVRRAVTELRARDA